jgi:hypothetical protein
MPAYVYARLAGAVLVRVAPLLLWTPAWVLAAASPNEQAQLPRPPFSVKWNVGPRGGAASQTFVLTQYRAYHFEIAFRRTDGRREIVTDPELSKVIGDGSTVFVTRETADSDNPTIVRGYTPGSHGPGAISSDDDGVRARAAHTGVMIPVHLRVELLKDGTPPVVQMDKVVKTWNFEHSSAYGLSRFIAVLKLRQGRYRVTAVAVQETPLPANLETSLVVTYYAKSRALWPWE